MTALIVGGGFFKGNSCTQNGEDKQQDRRQDAKQQPGVYIIQDGPVPEFVDVSCDLRGAIAEKFLNRVLRESDAGHRSEPHSIPNTIGQAISAKLTLQYRSSEFSGNFS